MNKEQLLSKKEQLLSKKEQIEKNCEDCVDRRNFSLSISLQLLWH